MMTTLEKARIHYSTREQLSKAKTLTHAPLLTLEDARFILSSGKKINKEEEKKEVAKLPIIENGELFFVCDVCGKEISKLKEVYETLKPSLSFCPHCTSAKPSTGWRVKAKAAEPTITSVTIETVIEKIKEELKLDSEPSVIENSSTNYHAKIVKNKMRGLITIRSERGFQFSVCIKDVLKRKSYAISSDISILTEETMKDVERNNLFVPFGE